MPMPKVYLRIGRELRRPFTRLFWWRAVGIKIARLFGTRPLALDPFDLSAFEGAAIKNIICFVSYAPEGLRADTKTSLKRLAQTPDTAVCLVANVGLSADDQAFLHAQGVRIYEGNNNGYDFGAYQRFALSLFDKSVSFERLILMNDSFIFPLDGEKVGPMFDHQGTDVHGLWYGNERKPKKLYLCSFLLNFSARVATSQPFKQFFETYRPSEDRAHTIKFGEVELSRRLFTAGFSHHAAYTKASLIAAVNQASTDEIHALINAPVTQDLFTKLGLSSKSANTAQTLIKAIASVENFPISHLFSALTNAQFVKLRDLRDSPSMRDWYVARYPAIRKLFH